MNKETKSEYMREFDNNINDRADLLFYISNLNSARSTYYSKPESPHLPNKLLDSDTADFFDFIVLSNPDKICLKEAYNKLDPKGYIYAEWSASVLSGFDRMENILQTAGFEDIKIYLLQPDPHKSLPRIYIPFKAPGTAEYVIFKGLLRNNNVLSILAFWFRKQLWKIAPKIFLTYPWLLSSSPNKFTLCSIARKPIYRLSKNDLDTTTNTSNKSPLGLVDRLQDSWEKWKLGIHPNKLSTLILCRGNMSYTKLILLVFAETNPVPSLVIKLPLTRHADNDSSNEANVLKTLNEKNKQIDGIPDLVFSDNTSGSHVVCETYISGILLHNIINKKNYRKFALSITSWLIHLAKETKTVLPTNWFNINIKQIISDLDNCMGSLLSEDTIEKTYKLLNNFKTDFLVCEHRDLTAANIIINKKGKLNVLDWETSRLYGLPALDLIFFLTRTSINYRLEPNSDSFEERYWKMLDPTTFTGAVFADCMDIYISELGIPQTYIRGLRLMTWIVQAHIKFLDLTTGTLEPQNELSEGTRFALRLWEEEVSTTK